jgi:hypothetical protein
LWTTWFYFWLPWTKLFGIMALKSPT